MAAPAPTRTLERELLGTRARIAGMDEVGRGALAGPVSVGVVVVDATTGRLPAGLRDSKLLTPAARARLCAPIRRWCVAGAVGHASPAEIDSFGIIGALRLAGHRALAQVCAAGHAPDLVLLDGVHDWLTPPAALPHVPALPALTGPGSSALEDGALAAEPAAIACPPVQVHVKGDLRISSIAAASVLAKTERDEAMIDHHASYPDFGWDSNKGYSAAAHAAALRRLGPSPLHRRSWRLPGTEPELVQASLLA